MAHSSLARRPGFRGRSRVPSRGRHTRAPLQFRARVPSMGADYGQGDQAEPGSRKSRAARVSRVAHIDGPFVPQVLTKGLLRPGRTYTAWPSTMKVLVIQQHVWVYSLTAGKRGYIESECAFQSAESVDPSLESSHGVVPRISTRARRRVWRHRLHRHGAHPRIELLVRHLHV
jgi:hypothetical protein